MQNLMHFYNVSFENKINRISYANEKKKELSSFTIHEKRLYVYSVSFK